MPTDDERVAAVFERLDLHDTADHADIGALLAAAGLLAPLDQRDAELGLVHIVGEEVGDELPVARLEDVERQDSARQQHRAERKHRHDSHPTSMTP